MPLRYGVTGGLATGFHYLWLLSLVEFWAWPASAATAVGAVFGALLAYFLNRHWTFSSRKSHATALPRFLAVALFSAGFNALLVWIGVELLLWHYLPVQLLSTLFLVSLGYWLNLNWTFGHEKSSAIAQPRIR